MPQRLEPLVTGEIYHIINRGVASMPIFVDDRHYRHFLETAVYYQHQKPSLRYSYFSRLPQSAKIDALAKLSKEYFVEIICYCLMPNHFHLLLKQTIDNGISNFMMKFCDSYTRYFNTKNNRIGPILQGRFKSVRIETEQQLLHVSRYIHLNPYSSGIVKAATELKEFPYSSLPEYLRLTKNEICQKEIVTAYFKKPGSYQEFVFEQADYQRELSLIKHLILENLEVD